MLQAARAGGLEDWGWVGGGGVDGLGGVSWEWMDRLGIAFSVCGDERGSVVLVRGATSSVGVWAVLLAKARGCIVIATTRQEGKIERLRAMGATHVVVEKTDEGGSSNYGKMVKDVLAIRADGVDTFVELVDSNSYNQLAFRVTAKFGTVAIAGVLGKGFAPQPFTPAMIPGTRRLSMHVGFEIADGVEECFREIAFGIRDGVFKSENFLDSVYKLEDVGKAHDEMQANLVCGKVFLDI